MINTKLQSIIDTKSAIGNAIVNKGGTITSETPFFNYAAQIDGISTGTPQTIFQASDGSKWALTNAVNLVNDAGNVTSDFNYWQPANNSTSDPILNIGTVGANISGNIQLVLVNQVNIAQFENIVINDTTGAKYVGYNGYDSVTNPTPTGNTTFNRWLLNNSAIGTVLFANTVITNGGTYNGPNSSINEASMPFVNNTANYGGGVLAVTTNNGFIYAGGGSPYTIQKFHESNLVRSANSSVNYRADIFTITTNNGFVYIGGDIFSGIDRGVGKYREDNLALVGNTPNFGTTQSIWSIKTNNSFLYIAGDQETGVNRGIGKYHESNLVLSGNTVNYGSTVYSMYINNGFIFAGGGGTGDVKKYAESNLSFSSNSNAYGGLIFGLVVNNGYVYAGGTTDLTIKKFHESNLAFVGNSPSYNGTIRNLAFSNGFIYAFGGNGTFNPIRKYYESNLAFVGETDNFGASGQTVWLNNSYIYAVAGGSQVVKQYEAQGISLDNLTFYTATKIKE